MGAAYSSSGQSKVLSATYLVLLGAKAKFLRRKQSVLVALEEISAIHFISGGILPTEHFPKFGSEVNNQNVICL